MTDGRPSAKVGRRFGRTRGSSVQPDLERRRVARERSGSDPCLGTSTRRSTSCSRTGKLYVPGAEETAPAMGRLVAAAREAGIVHVASADDHELTDPEISDEPDFRNTYPPHCLRGTRGAHEDPGDRAGRPAAALARALPARARAGADRGPPRAPAPEEELRRLHEPEHRGAARRARPGRDRRLRRRDRRLRRRGDPRLPARAAGASVSSRTPRAGSTRSGRGVPARRWREAGVEFTTADDVVASFGSYRSAPGCR